MLNKNQVMYNTLISRLPLHELSSLIDRSGQYPRLRTAIEEEIDSRISSGDVTANQFEQDGSTKRTRKLLTAN